MQLDYRKQIERYYGNPIDREDISTIWRVGFIWRVCFDNKLLLSNDSLSIKPGESLSKLEQENNCFLAIVDG